MQQIYIEIKKNILNSIPKKFPKKKKINTKKNILINNIFKKLNWIF